MENLFLEGPISTLITSKSKAVMSTQIRISDLMDVYIIDKEVNRDLGYHRIPKIVKYLENIDFETGIFFPSIVLSYRSDPLKSYTIEDMTLLLQDNLVVIDGQHRIKGIETFLAKTTIDSNLKNKVRESFLTAQIYFGLSIEDEKKLFTDINSNVKSVSRSLVTKYDTRNILNVLITELYNSSDSLKNVVVEFEKSRIVRPNNTTFTTSIRLKVFTSLLLFGKKSLGQKDQEKLKNQYDDLFAFLNKFFDVFLSSLPGVPGDVRQYVLGNEPVQNALAMYLNESIISDSSKDIKWINGWIDDVESIKSINWSVKNRDWAPYLMHANINNKNGYQRIKEGTTFEIKSIIEEKLI